MPHRVPGAWGAPRRGGQRRSGHRRRLPALSRALAGRDELDTVGHLSELGLESFHRWARALRGSEEGSLQLSLLPGAGAR